MSKSGKAVTEMVCTQIIYTDSCHKMKLFPVRIARRH